MAEALLGNDIQQSKLLHCLREGILPHSLLFSGIDGIGKKLFAMTLAKTMLCIHGNACGTCPSCLQISGATHPDLIVVNPNDKGTIHIGDEDEESTVRWLTARVSLASIHKYRVIIINDAHCMNIQAQNALLKTVEEPPQNTFIIIISAERTLLLPTIRSRTTEYVFRPLGDSDIVSILTQQGIPHHKHDTIIPVASGSASYALTLADDTVYSMLTDAYHAICQFVLHPRIFTYELSPIIQSVGPQKTIDLLINMFRLHCRSAVELSWANPSMNESTAADIIKLLLELRKALAHNINIRMALKGMLYSLCFK